MITYYNIVDKEDRLGRPLETWGLFKRNASSYIHDLAHSDQGRFSVKLREVTDYPVNGHDFQHLLPSPGTIANNQWTLKVAPYNMKVCIRDPFNRYCSGLVMVMFDLEEQYQRASTMDPYYHNGGREELLGITKPRSERDLRYLYCWRNFIRSLNNTVMAPDNGLDKDFTFGEAHLDPTITLAALMPYLHNEANVDFVDLRKWTEFTTRRLGIAETNDTVSRWNTPKLQGTRDKPAQPGYDMLQIIKSEMPYFSKTATAYEAPQNWRPTFEDWIQPESTVYQYLSNNRQIRNGSPEMNGLTELLIELLEDPYFLYRSKIVRRNYCDPIILEQLPKALSAAIINCWNMQKHYELSNDQRRIRPSN